MQGTVYPSSPLFASTKCRICRAFSPFYTCPEDMVTLSSFVNQRLLILVFFCFLNIFSHFVLFNPVFDGKTPSSAAEGHRLSSPPDTIYCGAGSGTYCRRFNEFSLFSHTFSPAFVRFSFQPTYGIINQISMQAPPTGGPALLPVETRNPAGGICRVRIMCCGSSGDSGIANRPGRNNNIRIH